tara:strand:- start:122 stop:628 length:507 start_codon:yes stop_codon:yes gene_type:complete
MKKRTVVAATCTLWLILSNLSFAQDQAPRYELATDVVLARASQVPASSIGARLGDLAVVKRSALPTATTYGATISKGGKTLTLIRDSLSGRYGTTDGSLLVQWESTALLEAIAASHALSVDQVFTGMRVAQLRPSKGEYVISVMMQLEQDARVAKVSLNTNFYDAGIE